MCIGEEKGEMSIFTYLTHIYSIAYLLPPNPPACHLPGPACAPAALGGGTVCVHVCKYI